MHQDYLRSILQAVAEGKRPVDSALDDLRNLPYEDLEFANLDHHRALRTGVGEVVFGGGKTPEQVAAIVDRFVEAQGRALVTRASPQMVDLVRRSHPDARYYEIARLLAVGEFPVPDPQGPFVAVVSAGTSDIPVAEEAALTIELHGARVERLYDVGVAGLHRLLDRRQILWQAAAVVTVAGMEGALATVVGGLVSVPVIAVPTSVGYGASLNGVAALLAMLNSCAPGVSVVNIDNGFGAGVCAYMIVRGQKCE
jgi:NCAIR mutase (PurE)-related protein